tara:strand:- start:1829 stop:2476 length:648 start_codon:yes stop_codon:yes gene_type:complete
MIKILSYKKKISGDNFSSTIDRLVDLHFKNLPSSLYTYLGNSALRIFYTLLLKSSFTTIYFAYIKSELSGFIILAPYDFSIIKSFLTQIYRININDLFFIIISILKKIFRYNLLRYDLFIKLITQKKENHHENTMKIVSIIVDSSNRGKGIGRSLIHSAINYCQLHSYKSISANTTSLQPDAVNFYKSQKNFILKDSYKDNIRDLYNYKFVCFIS